MSVRSNKVKKHNLSFRQPLMSDNGDPTSPDAGRGGGNKTIIPPSGPQKTHAENNVEPKINPWENPTQEVKDPATPQPVVITNPVSAPTQEQQTTAFNERIATMSFLDGNVAKDMFEKAGQGDMESFTKGLNTMGQEIFKQALTVSAQHNQQIVDKAVDAAIKKAGGNTSAELATRELEANFEQAKDPLVAPVIKGVFAKFVGQGQDVPTAISNTKKYMEMLGGKFTPQSSGRPGSGNYNNKALGIGFDTEGEAMDFDNILSQGSLTKPQQ